MSIAEAYGHAGRAPAAGAAEPAARARQHDRASGGWRRCARARSAPGASAPTKRISSRAASSGAAASSSTRRMRSGMCWSTITRTTRARRPAIRVLRPMLGEGLLIAEGRAWKHQRRTLAPAFTPRAVATLVPHMIAVTDETIAKLAGSLRRAGRSARGDAADDARDRRAHHVLVRDGPPRRDVARLRDGIWRAAGAAAFSRSAAAAELAEPAGFRPRPLPQAMDAFRRPC